MESHVVEAAEDEGRLEVEWLPFELRPAPKPLLEVRGDHLRTDWTSNVYRRALAAGIEIHLPRYQPRSTLTLGACLWAGDEGRLRDLQARALRGVLLRGARHRDRRGDRRAAAERAALDPVGGRGGGLRPRPRARLREIRREAEAAGVAGVPTLLTEDGRTHWGMGGVERLLADEPLVPRSPLADDRDHSRCRVAAMGIGVDRERSAARIEREIETLSGPEFTTIERGDPALRLHARVPADARPLRRRAPRARVHRRGGSRRHARRAQPTRRRAGVRHRLALRLEPERRPLRRDDGRRHRARGLPPERRARPRPAVPARLVPRGGGLGLRPDAAREPDHAAARHRGGPPRALPRDRRRAELLGARRGGRATSPRAGGSRSRSSTV